MDILNISFLPVVESIEGRECRHDEVTSEQRNCNYIGSCDGLQVRFLTANVFRQGSISEHIVELICMFWILSSAMWPLEFLKCF